MISVYDEIWRRGLENGMLCATTADNHMIEIYLYAGLIINVKMRGFSPEQALEVIAGGAIRDIGIRPGRVNTGDLSAEVLEKTLMQTISRANVQDKASVLKLVRTLNLMLQAAADGNEGFAVLPDRLEDYLSGINPNFSMKRIDMLVRLEGLKKLFGEMLLLDYTRMPVDDKKAVGWVLEQIGLTGGNVLADNVAFYIFFGELISKVIIANTKKDDGLGAKKGVVKLSQVKYPQLSSGSKVSVFYRMKKVADMPVNLHKATNTDVIFTKADLDSLGLQEGHPVAIVPQ
jgi:hypothetical protein